MAIDWFAFLRQHNIPYTTTGPNASRGRVNIRCPFCGEDDPSEHLGISLNNKGWNCWRNSQHRGRDNARLIAELLNCGYQTAKELAYGGVSVPTDDELQSVLHARLGSGMATKPVVNELFLRREFKPLNNGSLFANQFIEYLQKERHYRKTQLKWLIENYDLHYTTRGKFAYRIIIPYYDRWQDKLLTWTGRTILKDEEERYKSLKRDEQICSPKETLLGLPLLHRCPNPKALLVCEGPFDAFWISVLGHPLGVYGTCLSGLTLSDQQAELILGLKGRFPYIGVLLDSAATFQAFRIANSGLDLGIEKIPDNVKDPAELPSGKVVDMCLSLLNRS